MLWFHSLAITKHFNYKHLGEGRVSLAYVFRLQSIPEGLRRASAVETTEDNARQLALGIAWAHAQILSLCSTEKGAAPHSKLTMKTCVWTQLIKRYSIETLPPPVSSKLCRVDSWCHCGRRGAENTVDQGAAQIGRDKPQLSPYQVSGTSLWQFSDHNYYARSTNFPTASRWATKGIF